ncbi:hypothetical protein [Frisingicoccus sp.]|uniref:hypothetical protein n=1 Tax=Frisingicoccus sp. TaxID=1918627 RepID=UPI003AB14148
MYNLDGIYYYMTAKVFAYLAGGILGLLLSRFCKYSKNEIRVLIVGGILLIVFSAKQFIFYRQVLQNPEICFFEGQYKEEHRSHDVVWAMDYGFVRDNGDRKWVHLDYKTKKNIFPEDFEKGPQYRIYYEKETNIIVKVEELEQ